MNVHDTLSTIGKGLIGMAPPIYALTFHIDAWAAPIQWCLGGVIPTLVALNLMFDLKKKYSDNEDLDRKRRMRRHIEDYYKNKRKNKQKQIRKKNNENPNTPKSASIDDVTDSMC